jgi:transcriptional regulator with XRE-family HTH domain
VSPPGARAHRQLLDSDRLRTVRIEQGLTLHGLAKAIGRTGKCLRAIEAGRNHDAMTLGDLANLAAALGVGVLDLLATPAVSPRPEPSDNPSDCYVLRRHEAKLLLKVLRGEVRRAEGGSAVVRLALGKMEIAGIIEYPDADHKARRAPRPSRAMLYSLGFDLSAHDTEPAQMHRGVYPQSRPSQ